MDELKPLCAQLYRVAKLYARCECELEKTWSLGTGGSLIRKVIKQCSVCVAIAAYDLKFPVAA